MRAYKFSDTAVDDMPDILRGLTPKEFLSNKYNNALTFGEDNLLSTGCFKYLGWCFDFKGYMKQYVYSQYETWTQVYAPNKTALRKAIHGKIDKIVEVK